LSIRCGPRQIRHLVSFRPCDLLWEEVLILETARLSLPTGD